MTRGTQRGTGADEIKHGPERQKRPPETDACSQPEESNSRKKNVGSIISVDMIC